MRYTKKPVTIEAVRFMGINEDGDPMFSQTPEWLVEAVAGPEHSTGSIWAGPGQAFIGEGEPPKELFIGTMEGQIIASKGDWIIRGIKGELYPCRDDIFQATYDVTADDPDEATGCADDALPGSADEWSGVLQNAEQSMLLDMQSECIQLRQALAIARDQFAFYAAEHQAKADNPAAHYGDAEKSKAKSDVNHGFAVMCQQAIDCRPATGPAEALIASLAETDVEHASDLPTGSVDRLRTAARPFVIGEGFVPQD